MSARSIQCANETRKSTNCSVMKQSKDTIGLSRPNSAPTSPINPLTMFLHFKFDERLQITATDLYRFNGLRAIHLRNS